MNKHAQLTPLIRPASDSESTSEWIEKILADCIATGQIMPAERLDELGLSVCFGVSRTPVREALNRLHAQGIVVSGKKRGLFVATYSREELAQMFEAMHEIEITCARLVAQRLNLLTRCELENCQKACLQAAERGDTVAYLRANENFHNCIYQATGNIYMSEIASRFRRRTGPFRAKKFQSKEDLVESACSHDSLLRDIFSQDSTTASNGMRNHMRESYLKTLKMNP